MHAKIYLFDDTAAYIGSANLTPSGMNKNLECGVLIQERQAVKELIERLAALCKEDEAAPIVLSTLQQTQPLLDNLPKPPPATAPDNDVLAVPAKRISETICLGWTKEKVFKRINEKIAKMFFIEATFVFSFFEAHFVPNYPNNQYIKDKIRQQLQILRVQELLEVQGNGFYRLWHETKED